MDKIVNIPYHSLYYIFQINFYHERNISATLAKLSKPLLCLAAKYYERELKAKKIPSSDFHSPCNDIKEKPS